MRGREEILKVHVKNVKRYKEKRWDYVPRGDVSYEWKSLEEGDLNWQDLLAKAKSGGFDGPVEVEIFSSRDWWQRDADDVVRTIIARAATEL